MSMKRYLASGLKAGKGAGKRFFPGKGNKTTATEKYFGKTLGSTGASRRKSLNRDHGGTMAGNSTKGGKGLNKHIGPNKGMKPGPGSMT